VKKELIIVGGANGVGKTTFAYQYKMEYGIGYLSADDIARGRERLPSGNLELQAGKEFFRRLQDYYSENKSVIIESTLSGLGLARNINRFRANGYSVHMIYVFLDSIEMCKARIRLRVQKGGHNVPTVDIERRFRRSLMNFRKTYISLADTWQLLYNGFERPLEVAVGELGRVMVSDEEFYKKFQEMSQ
jgi:predicted ABC-type ATPase